MNWEQASPYPGPGAAAAVGRHHPVTFANETHAFLLSGTTAAALGTSDFYLYEEAADAWTELTTTASAFPGAPFSFGYGVTLNELGNSKAYVGFGMAADGTVLQTSNWWEFDMTTHVWTSLADFPGPGRKHPAMVATASVANNEWHIHVGLGDDGTRNFNDWWVYDINTNSWAQQASFPGTARHHPFYFSLRDAAYAGLGHSGGGIERDWYQFTSDGIWQREADFASYEIGESPSQAEDGNDVAILSNAPVTTEARVAGTQFAIELPLTVRQEFEFEASSLNNNDSLSGSWGFVLSGDGDDHRTMATGEFHAFDANTSRWIQLPPHPGASRWAPGSWVMRGTARVYMSSGYDRSSDTLYADLWRIDLSSLFLNSQSTDANSNSTATTVDNGSSTTMEDTAADAYDEEAEVAVSSDVPENLEVLTASGGTTSSAFSVYSSSCIAFLIMGVIPFGTIWISVISW